MPGFREFECMFLREQPQYDLLKDAPPEQYKYMSLPLRWPKGDTSVPEPFAMRIRRLPLISCGFFRSSGVME